MSETARIGAIRHMNDALPRCRHEPSVARATLERLRASSKGTIDPVFTVEERRLLIATRGLRWFTVEGYQPEELAALDQGCSRAHDPRSFERVPAMVLGADVEQAARLHGAGLEGFARGFVAPRNDRIVAGFEQLAGDLRVLLPDLLRRREIRVLARFGSAHLHMAERLTAQGLQTSLCGAPPLSLADEIIVRLTREPEAHISLEESLRSGILGGRSSGHARRGARGARIVAECQGARGAAAPQPNSRIVAQKGSNTGEANVELLVPGGTRGNLSTLD